LVKEYFLSDCGTPSPNSAERDGCEHPKKRPRIRVAINLENPISNSRELINIAKEKLEIKKAYYGEKLQVLGRMAVALEKIAADRR
jgi:hypothetical protein